MQTSRIALTVLAIAALAAAGCFLITGQIVVSFAMPSPFTALNTGTLASVDVDLNTVSEYSKHKNELKQVEDLALTGDFHNNTSSPANVSVYIVPACTAGLTTAQLTSGQGVALWGPLAVAANGTEHIDWNRSSGLFTGRQALIDEIKGDGHFRLYFIANGAFDVTITNGAVVSVLSAGK